ncbi:MAG: hypothetical protein QXW52_08655 [Candidatus Caldarchaeum sp.]
MATIDTQVKKVENAFYNRQTINKSIRALKKAIKLLRSRVNVLRYTPINSPRYWLKLAYRKNMREVDSWLNYFLNLKNTLAAIEASAAGAECACCGYLGLKNAYMVVVNGLELFVGPECARHFPIRVCRDRNIVPYTPRHGEGK